MTRVWSLALCVVLLGCHAVLPYQARGGARDVGPVDDPGVADAAVATTESLDAAPFPDATPHCDTAVSDTWSGSLTITINAHTLGLDADLQNYPLALRFNVSNFPDIATRTRSQGADIRFETTGGTPLPHEIEDWKDATSGAVWVLVDRIARDAATTIVMKYDNPAALSASDSMSVFATANGFRGVWHLNEAATDENTTAIHRDATSNRNDGKQAGNEIAAGNIGNAQRFDGVDDHISVPHGNSLVMTKEVSMSAWVKLESSPEQDAWYCMMSTSHAVSTQAPYYSTYIFNRWKKGNIVCTDFTLNSGRVDLWNARQTFNLQQGSWTHVATTFDGSEFRFYANGVLDSRKAVSGNIESTASVALVLAAGDGNDYLHGYIDEARVFNQVLSVDWIKLDHATQRWDQTAVTF